MLTVISVTYCSCLIPLSISYAYRFSAPSSISIISESLHAVTRIFVLLFHAGIIGILFFSSKVFAIKLKELFGKKMVKQNVIE